MENINLSYKKFPFFKQLESADCGPTCLKMIARFYGKKVDIHSLRELCHINKNGVNFADLIDASNKLGFETVPVKITLHQLIHQAPKPCLLHWKDNHYVVFLGTTKKGEIVIADPGFGKLKLNKSDVLKFWKQDANNKGIALLLEPNDNFSTEEIKTNQEFEKVKYFMKYLKPFKTKFAFLLLLLLGIAGISVFYPLINEKLVDQGISNNNIQFVVYLLIAQLVLYTSTNVLEFFQGWIFLKVNTRLSINLISDFLKKLITMPLSFFDSKLTTDIMLRVDDHNRIEEFFSNHSLQFCVSIIVFIIYSILLLNYSSLVFGFFLFVSALSILWVYRFQNQRKYIDYKRFEIETENKNILYEIVNGISDLKINNATTYKTSQWQKTETDLFELNKKTMLLELKQSIGINYMSQLKNTLIIGYVAYLVIGGELTFGALLSISFIIGQLTLPIESFIQYLYSYQDASISIDRLSDVYRKKDEEQLFLEHKQQEEPDNFSNNNAISFTNARYSYLGPNSPSLFENLNINFPLNKVTAIVGTSGSGKTTIIKLLLKYYQLLEGEIRYKGKNVDSIEPNKWRDLISVVFQEGYIFSDSVQGNITLGAEFDKKRFEKAVYLSNSYEFIDKLPQKELTKIGENGLGLSKGQIQRILIARAMYKDPEIIILDEATSALDAENERIIHDNLQEFFKNRTVIIIAHRLSTVKNADKIIVLKNGKVIEEGPHKMLVEEKGDYYSLVKNQLELGN
ncbi:peptidase domain-containing ABC transporter [Tenacibaculum sp. 190524A02b]|uniref:peptidase domain-containing ABC transporter n=1 Tax=Tenacibaculum vairaonense TaxID=3137860 RepID=UPI0031FB14DF